MKKRMIQNSLLAAVCLLIVYLFAEEKMGTLNQVANEGNRTEVKPSPQSKPNELRIPVEKIRYERTGGGNLEFIVQRLDDAYEITVTKYDFKDVSTTYRRERSEFDSTTLGGLFDGNVSLARTPAVPDGQMVSGTWVEIYLFYDDCWNLLRNADVTSALGSLESIIRKQNEGSRIQPSERSEQDN